MDDNVLNPCDDTSYQVTIPSSMSFEFRRSDLNNLTTRIAARLHEYRAFLHLIQQAVSNVTSERLAMNDNDFNRMPGIRIEVVKCLRRVVR